MVSDWEIGRRSAKCSATDRELAEGEAYYAVLLETPEGFERRDYTLDSWQGPPEGAFCHWRGRVPIREKANTPTKVDTALLTQLFLRLEEEESDVKQQFRFMLALLLMRKRLLKMAETVHEDDREYWQLMLMSDRSTHRVLNPQLSSDEVARLSAQLTAILAGEVDVAEALEWTEAPSSPEPEEATDAPDVTDDPDSPPRDPTTEHAHEAF